MKLLEGDLIWFEDRLIEEVKTRIDYLRSELTCREIKDQLKTSMINDCYELLEISGHFNPTVTVYPDKVSDMGFYLKWLAGLGWRRRGDGTGTRCDSTMTWILYHLNHDDKMFLTLNGDFSKNKGKDNACSLIQTGTETKEVPVWELVCPDDIKEIPL